MAVYTEVSQEDLKTFLDENYSLGTFQNGEGIAEGTENTNFHILCDTGEYILTLFEKRTPIAYLPYFVSLMETLARKGFPALSRFQKKNGII